MLKLRSVFLSLVALVTIAGLPFSMSTIAAAQENDVVGHYALPDEGFGGHAGGPLYRDGTAGAEGFLNLLDLSLRDRDFCARRRHSMTGENED